MRRIARQSSFRAGRMDHDVRMCRVRNFYQLKDSRQRPSVKVRRHSPLVLFILCTLVIVVRCDYQNASFIPTTDECLLEDVADTKTVYVDFSSSVVQNGIFVFMIAM